MLHLSLSNRGGGANPFSFPEKMFLRPFILLQTCFSPMSMISRIKVSSFIHCRIGFFIRILLQSVILSLCQCKFLGSRMKQGLVCASFFRCVSCDPPPPLWARSSASLPFLSRRRRARHSPRATLREAPAAKDSKGKEGKGRGRKRRGGGGGTTAITEGTAASSSPTQSSRSPEKRSWGRRRLSLSLEHRQPHVVFLGDKTSSDQVSPPHSLAETHVHHHSPRKLHTK